MKNKDREKLAKKMARRIYLLRETEELSVQALADATNTSWMMVDRYEKAEVVPGALWLFNLRLATGVDLNWLITGEE